MCLRDRKLIEPGNKAESPPWCRSGNDSTKYREGLTRRAGISFDWLDRKILSIGRCGGEVGWRLPFHSTDEFQAQDVADTNPVASTNRSRAVQVEFSSIDCNHGAGWNLSVNRDTDPAGANVNAHGVARTGIPVIVGPDQADFAIVRQAPLSSQFTHIVILSAEFGNSNRKLVRLSTSAVYRPERGYPIQGVRSLRLKENA